MTLKQIRNTYYRPFCRIIKGDGSSYLEERRPVRLKDMTDKKLTQVLNELDAGHVQENTEYSNAQLKIFIITEIKAREKAVNLLFTQCVKYCIVPKEDSIVNSKYKCIEFINHKGKLIKTTTLLNPEIKSTHKIIEYTNVFGQRVKKKILS